MAEEIKSEIRSCPFFATNGGESSLQFGGKVRLWSDDVHRFAGFSAKPRIQLFG
jgi:hypothetical protein